MVRHIVLVLLCGTALPGCSIAVNALHKDQDLIRCALLDLYTNQIMDNLVRAANGMPIIQLDYGQAQGTITIRNTIGGSDSQAATVTNVLALPAATLSATRTIMTTLMGNLADENTNQVAVVATPVTTSNEVYDAYLEFLSLPGSLMMTCDPPQPGAAHICKKYKGNYFWVPVQYRGPFFKLSLLTTAQRGKGLLPLEEFFTVQLKEIISEEPSAIVGARVLTIRLDKKIPTDTGYLVLDADNEHEQFLLQSVPGVTASETDVIKVAVQSGKLKLFRSLPQAGKIFLLHRRPKPPTTDDLINRVNFQLQQIQFNQLRAPGL